MIFVQRSNNKTTFFPISYYEILSMIKKQII
jgi:hypothetical protein